MGRRSTSGKALEEDNWREIGKLKEVLSQLDKTVAINTEATKGLKEAIEKELNRHVEDRKGLDGRVTVVETKLESVELKLAADASVRERLELVEQATSKLGGNLEDMQRDNDKRDGWSAGVKWALGIGLVAVGFVCSAVLRKLFGM